MPVKKYTYSIANDTLNGEVDLDHLRRELEEDQTILYGLAAEGIQAAGDVLDIYLKSNLSDYTTEVTSIVNAHDGTHDPYEPETVIVQPNREGYKLCDRDFRLCTGVLTNSYEDLYIKASDNIRYDWGELTLQGCYKDDAGSMVTCTDQADADTNACLTIWNYSPKKLSDGTAVDIGLRGGAITVDPSLVGTTQDDLFKHQFYAVAAPDIPSSMGGSVRFFDSYLKGVEGSTVETLNERTSPLDPTQVAAAGILRIWMFYPEGAKQNHILRLYTFRKPESM
jgi:hypothetical protein